MRRLAVILTLVLAWALPLSAMAKPARRKPGRRPTPAASGGAPTPDRSTDDGDDGDAKPSVADPAPDTAAPAPAARTPAPRPAPSDPADNEEKPAAAPAAPAPGPSPDLQRLRADYDRLRDELYRARARAQLVQEGLYPSKISATLRWKGAPDYVIRRAELRLDGASLWDSGDKPVTDDLIKVAERPIKPGPHALTVRLEIRPGTKKSANGGQNTEQLGYVSEHTFALVIPDGKRTSIAITGDEDGDAPEYEPEIEVELESQK